MSLKQEKIQELLEKVKNSTANADECEQLLQFVNGDDATEVIGYINQFYTDQNLAFTDNDNPAWKAIVKNIVAVDKIGFSEEQETKVVKTSFLRRYWAAASILIVLGIAAYFWMTNQKQSQPDTVNVTVPNDVKAPDKNRAQIKLADGTIVYLDSAANGNLASMQGVTVVKTADGKIEYRGDPSTSSGPVVSGELKYNTLFNPRGSIVMDMTLADGSRVWLNAGSSITYPVAFTSNERKVSIDGEAYFEVAHNPTKPFIVSKGELNVTVLGTHFNVNGYDDENDIKVTLLEGSVNVRQNAENKMLKPGQQAIANPSTPLRVANNVDVEQVMAWKNGVFSYNGVDLKTIMREVSRWYDVETVFENYSDEKFYVEVNRNTNVSTLFKMLEKTKAVHFKIEGKKIIVTQ